MKVAFTICSNNYLAKAKVVSDTFLVNHPDYTFYFFLVDKKVDKLDYRALTSNEIIEVGTVVQNMEELASKYNIVELNTAVKPAIFQYLFKELNYTIAIYLDPDVMVFDRFIEVEQALDKDDISIVVTPHFCSPIDDGKYPSEIDFAPFGLYNLGFIAIKKQVESGKFLDWWNNRLMKYCYIKPTEGMFTDQLWVNYAPVLFSEVYILKHVGYNIANWNLYERIIKEDTSNIYVNDTFKLKFFHFSHYDYKFPNRISKYQNRYTLEDRPDLKKIFELYRTKLEDNSQEDFNNSICYYNSFYKAAKDNLKKQNRSILSRLKSKLLSNVK